MTNIVACIDGTSVSTAVCDYASWAHERLGAPVELMHVLHRDQRSNMANLSGAIGIGSREHLLKELVETDERRSKLALDHGMLILSDAGDRVSSRGVMHPIRTLRHGLLVDTLREHEDVTRLLVVGKHADHMDEHVGSRLETIIRTIHRPILVCSTDFAVPQRVLIAFDGSETMRNAIELITKSPLLTSSTLTVLTVGAETPTQKSNLSWAVDTLSAGGLTSESVHMTGSVERCLVEATADYDMVIMGAYGHSTIRRFLVGSTTTHVLRHTSVPLLILR
jgi:nucleotide-binding universal stress UspA family protein